MKTSYVAKPQYGVRFPLNIRDGSVLIGSDAHYYPGKPSCAHRAFVNMIYGLQPKAVILNGDVMDGASISRHPAIGWEKKPTVAEELAICLERTEEIYEAAPNGCKLVWNLGNHDGRFATRLAEVAPEYRNVRGFQLKDHFPHWTPAWSTRINQSVVVKHRFNGGTSATLQNVQRAGLTTITGHLHSLKVTPFSDYNGTRWGVDTGCLCDPYGPQSTDWTEDNPVDWRSGFVVLTFVGGRLLWPEVVHVVGKDKVSFRGQVHKV